MSDSKPVDSADPELGTHATAENSAVPPPAQLGWLQELVAAGTSLRALWHAHAELVFAEWRLTRNTASVLLWCSLLVVVLAIAFGLSLLALAVAVLASWLQSWALALVVVNTVLALLLTAALVVLVRNARHVTLPRTRAQWHRTVAGLHAAGWASQSRSQETTDDEN